MTLHAPAPERRLTATDAHLLPSMKPTGTPGRILEASLQLFAETGFAGASVRDIADICQIRAATVYAHFPSKQHLLAELCRLGHAEHSGMMRTALMSSGASPVEQIRALVTAHVNFHTRFPMLALVANAELHHVSDELSPPIFLMRNQSIQFFIDVIQRGVDLGVFDVPDVWMATAAVGGMGLRVAYWFNPKGDVPADRVADTYADFALRILNVKTEAEHRPGRPK